MTHVTAISSKGPFVGTSALEGKRLIYDVMQFLRPETGLDIGCGSGTYARLFPEIDWTGVEVWEPYVSRFSLDRLYERFILADARQWTPDAHYDVAVAGDVLEHMTQDEATEVLSKLRYCSGHVIVSIPVVHFPQVALEGNPFEEHVVEDWSVNRVVSAFGDPSWFGVDGPIGVFVWKGTDRAV